jgi:hypothetical protein
MTTDYHPARYHIEQIKNFLAGRKESWEKIAEEIAKELALVVPEARILRRNILYPETEKEIETLKKKIDEKNNQLKAVLDNWSREIHEIQSALNRANSAIYWLLENSKK